MPNNKQIQLIQTARRTAGLEEGRYRLLLSQYKRPTGAPVTSCKQLDRRQVDDFLAICESMGWRYPGRSETYYRDKAAAGGERGEISTAQMRAIRCVAGDLGMNEEGLKTFVRRMTGQRTGSLLEVTRHEAWQITEALIAMLGRRDGVNYETLDDVKKAYR